MDIRLQDDPFVHSKEQWNNFDKTDSWYLFI